MWREQKQSSCSQPSDPVLSQCGNTWAAAEELEKQQVNTKRAARLFTYTTDAQKRNEIVPSQTLSTCVLNSRNNLSRQVSIKIRIWNGNANLVYHKVCTAFIYNVNTFWGLHHKLKMHTKSIAKCRFPLSSKTGTAAEFSKRICLQTTRPTSTRDTSWGWRNNLMSLGSATADEARHVVCIQVPLRESPIRGQIVARAIWSFFSRRRTTQAPLPPRWV